MTLMEKLKNSPLLYSPQAIAVLSSFKDEFPLEEFEAFAQKNFFVIGGQHLIAFLDMKERTKRQMLQKLNPIKAPIPNEPT